MTGCIENGRFRPVKPGRGFRSLIFPFGAAGFRALIRRAAVLVPARRKSVPPLPSLNSFPAPGASGRAAARGALLLAALVLWLPAVAQAQAPTERILVSSTGQAQSQKVGFRLHDFAQRFMTGMAPDGYVLSSLEMKLRSDAATISNLTVTLRNVSSGNPGSMVLATFVNPDSPVLSTVGQTFRFTLSEDEELDPDTRYFIHLSNDHATDTIDVALTVSDNQDSSGLADWGIDDIGRVFRSSAWRDLGNSQGIKIQLRGYAPPVLSTAEVNGDELVLTYDGALDASSVPAAAAFTVTAGGATVSVSTVSMSGMAVTLGLASAVRAGQTVLLDYVVPSSNPLQNGVDLAAGALIGQVVENRTLAAPSAPTVSAVSGQSDRLAVSWTAPANTGPPITGYNVRYCRGAAAACATDAAFAGRAFTVTATAVTIAMLMASTEHQVQVRATNAEGAGPWSASGAGATAAAAPATLSGLMLSSGGTNFALAPAFASGTGSYAAEVPAGTATVTVAATATDAGATVTVTPADAVSATSGHQVALAAGDNAVTVQVTAAGKSAGAYTVTVNRSRAPVFTASAGPLTVAEDAATDADLAGGTFTATDADGDAVAYALSGTDASAFVLRAASGSAHLRAVALDHEAAASHVLTVTASDGRGGSAQASVAVTVMDVDEPPSAPSAPTVSAVSGQIDRLAVNWAAPANTGPPITDYDVRYCRGLATACTTDADFTGHDFTGTARMTTIAMLDAATEHQVQVRATNAEGTGPWSASGSGSTETPMLTARFVGDVTTAVYLVEGDELELTVRLSGAPGRQVAIPLETRRRFGASSADYTGVPSSLTFGATETERSFTVTVVDDSEIDIGENVIVEFGTPAPSGIVLPGEGTAIGSRIILLVDNDFLYQASYQPSRSYSPGEASGTLTVTVRLRAPEGIAPDDLLALNETVAVSVASTDSTATAGEDYTVLSELTLSFAPTDFATDGSPILNSPLAEKTVTVSITDDAIHEGATPETFTLALSHDSGQRVEYVPSSGGETATVSIIDDEDPPMPRLVADAVSVSEGDADLEVALTVEMPGSRYAAAQALTLDFSGTAQESTSTVPADYSVSVRSVMIAANSMDDVAAGTVTVRNDTQDEDPEEETIVVRLLDGAMLLSSATITVSDDDDPAVLVAFGATSYPLAEGGTAVVSVSVSEDPERQLVIPLTESVDADGDGLADWEGVPTAVTFTAGTVPAQWVRRFTVTAVDDAIDDDGESLTLGFGTLPDARVSAGTPPTATLPIADNEDPPMPRLVADAVSVSEGDADLEVALTVEMPGSRYAVAQALTLDFSGTAQESTPSVPADYSVSVRSVMIAANSMDDVAAGTVTVRNDTQDEDPEEETIVVRLLDGATLLSSATITVSDDDDPAVSVAFGADEYPLAEGGTAVVSVSVSDDPERQLVIPLTESADADGDGLADWEGVPAAVTFTAGTAPAQWVRRFTVSAVDDAIDDDGESLTLGFGTLPDERVSAGALSSATLPITDNEGPPMPRLVVDAVSVSEGDADLEVALTVEMPGSRYAVAQALTLDFSGTAQESTPSVPADYSVSVRSVMIAANSMDDVAAGTVTVRNDTQDEDPEEETIVVRLLDGATLLSSATITVSDDDDPAVSVAFGADEYPLAEGGTAVVSVSVSDDPERQLVIPLTESADADGDGLADWEGVPAAVTFTAGTAPAQWVRRFTVTAVDDAIDDDGESLTLGFGTLPDARVSAGALSSATLPITDNEGPPMPRLVADAVSVSEGDADLEVALTVEMPGSRYAVAQALTLDFSGTAQESTPSVPADYSVSVRSVMIAANSMDDVAAGTVTVRNDTQDEDPEEETIVVRLLDGATLLSSATITVSDDDDPAVSVAFGADEYPLAEGGTAVVSVSVSDDPERQLVIPLTESADADGDGLADWEGVPAAVTFTAGTAPAQWVRRFTVTAVDDAIDDDGESLTLGFGTLPDERVSAGALSSATLPITDNEGPPMPRLVADAVSVSEGDADLEVALTVEMPGSRYAVAQALTLDFSGTAQESTPSVPADYSVSVRSVMIAANSMDDVAAGTVTVRNDTQDEDPEEETIVVRLLDGATLLSSATITVSDDDDPAVSVAFGADEYPLAEGGTAVVSVSVSEDPERQLVIPLTESADADGDGLADWEGVPAAVTFTAGTAPAQWVRRFTVTAVDDAIDDDGESLTLGFGTLPDERVSAGALSSATLPITDNEGPPMPRLVADAVSVSEGDADLEVALTVEMPGSRYAVAQALTLDFSGTAQESTPSVPADYSVSVRSVMIAANSMDDVAAGTVTVRNDTQDEDPEEETIVVRLLDGATLLSSVTITVSDDDDPAVSVAFGAASYPLAEGGTVVVSVSVSDDPERQLMIPLTESADADGDGLADWEGVPAAVTFTAGTAPAQWVRRFTVTAVDDAIDDDGESLTLGLGTLPDARVSAGMPPTATVLIMDDEGPPMPRLVADAASVSEGDADLEVALTVEMPGSRYAAAQALTLDFSGTAQESTPSVPADYSVSVRSVMIAANSMDDVAAGTVTVRNDTQDEDPEEETIVVRLLDGATLLSSATITVSDDDDPAVSVAFGADEYPLAEGGTAVVSVSVSEDPERQLVIPLTESADADGDGLADWEGVPAAVTFTAGTVPAQWVRRFTVTAVDDAIDDDGESLTLGLGTLPDARVSTGTPPTATLPIGDDDARGVTPSEGSLEVDETDVDATATYTLVLDTQPTAAVTVALTVEDTELLTTLPRVSPSSLVFTASDWNRAQTVTVAVPPDADSVDEVVTVRHAVSGGDYAGSSAADVVVKVFDADQTASGVLLALSPSRLAEDAGATAVGVTARLGSGALGTATAVSVAFGGGTASASDYRAQPERFTLIIPAGSVEATATLTVTPVDDGEDEFDETVRVTGSAGSGLPVSNVLLTIVDDDTREVAVSPRALTVAEGAQGIYTVSLGSQPSGEVTVTVSLAGAATGAMPLPTELVFTASDYGARAVTVTVADDEDVEADARATLSHEVSGANYGAAGVMAEPVSLTVPGHELTTDGVLLLVTGTPPGATVPSGTSAPAGLSLSLPDRHAGTTVRVRTAAPPDAPPGFRLGDTVADIDGVVTLEDRETATVCLPTAEEGERSVQRWDMDMATSAWVVLDAPSGGSPEGRVCGVTDHFSVFAVMVALVGAGADVLGGAPAGGDRRGGRVLHGGAGRGAGGIGDGGDPGGRRGRGGAGGGAGGAGVHGGRLGGAADGDGDRAGGDGAGRGGAAARGLGRALPGGGMERDAGGAAGAGHRAAGARAPGVAGALRAHRGGAGGGGGRGAAVGTGGTAGGTEPGRVGTGGGAAVRGAAGAGRGGPAGPAAGC